MWKWKYTSILYKPLYFRISLLKQFSLFPNLYSSLLSRFPQCSLPCIRREVKLPVTEAKSLSHSWFLPFLHSNIQVTSKSYRSIKHNYLETPICPPLHCYRLSLNHSCFLANCNSFRASLFIFILPPQNAFLLKKWTWHWNLSHVLSVPSLKPFHGFSWHLNTKSVVYKAPPFSLMSSYTALPL